MCKIFEYRMQWRSQYRGKGAEYPLDSEKIVKNRGKYGKKSEKERKNLEKNWEKEEKSGRKGQTREGSFTLPLLIMLINRAGYATDRMKIMCVIVSWRRLVEIQTYPNQCIWNYQNTTVAFIGLFSRKL